MDFKERLEGQPRKGQRTAGEQAGGPKGSTWPRQVFLLPKTLSTKAVA